MLEPRVEKSPYAAPLRYSQLKDLKFVWEESPDSKGSGKKAGHDRVSATTFKENLSTNLDRIRADLKNRSYKFQPLKAFFIEKGNGKERVICVPTVRDRLVQRLIAYHLIKKFDPKKGTQIDKFGVCNSVSFGIRGSEDSYIAAIDEALKRRSEHPWVLKTDIKAFFDAITRETLIAKIKSKLDKKSSLIPLLEQVVHCEVNSKQWHLERVRLQAQGLKQDLGLRQGMPLSPLLSNFFLGEFDLAVSKAKLNIIRYADDIIVFCDNEQECKAAEKLIKELLDKLHLEIPELQSDNKGKTFIVSPNEAALFLGVELKKKKTGGYVKAIPQNSINKLFEKQNRYKDLDFCLEKGFGFPDVVSHFKRKVEGYQASYKGTENLDSFVTDYKKQSEAVVEHLLTSILGGKVVASLDAKKRNFLGLSA
jgi:RNA-directed DNA polymerase